MTTVFQIPEDHDQRFKVLIREFFGDFLRLFFVDWAARFDLDAVEWLDTELLPDPPDGSRHKADLVAKLKTLEAVEPDHWIALVHIEVESAEQSTLIKPRLPSYYLHLRERYGYPVLPIVLYLQVGLDGIGVDSVVEKFWELETLKLQYLYVGLPRLDGESYIHGENWLGVALASLMKLPEERIAELGLLAFQKLNSAGLNEQRTFLLNDCFDTYLEIDDKLRKAIVGRIQFHRQKGDTTMRQNKSMFAIMREEGIAEGREEGREDGLAEGLRLGRLELIEAQLDSKFGTLAEASLKTLRSLTDAEIRNLGLKLAEAESLAELGL